MTVIRNATIIPMTGEATLRGHDALILGSSIVEIRESGKFLPGDARIVEGAGKFLIPGLTDSHTHPFTRVYAQVFAPMLPGAAEPEWFVLPSGLLMFQYLAAGVTRIEVMAGEPDILHMRAAVASGKMHGPRMTVGSPLVDGYPSYHSPLISWIVRDAKGGREAARTIASRGYDFAKTYTNLPDEAYDALVEECGSLGVRLMGHIPTAVGVEKAVRLGQQGIAHAAEYFWMMPDPERSDLERISRMAQRTAQTGAWVHTTAIVFSRSERVLLGAHQASSFQDSEFCNPLLRKVLSPDNEWVQAFMARPQAAMMMDRVEELTFETIRRLKAAGVGLLTGTDVANWYMADGFSLHEELELLVTKCGFSPLEALRASTAAAAEYHGHKGRAGVVAPGAVADLVLLDANPLQSITATRSIEAVVANGALIRRAAIEQGRRRILAAFAAMPIPA